MIKTIETDSVERLEIEVNEYLKTQPCFATQTHVTCEGPNNYRYTAVMFYNEVRK